MVCGDPQATPQKLTCQLCCSGEEHSTKTTEFYAMIVIAGILIVSWIVGQGDDNGKANVGAFPPVRAWLYLAVVGVGYMSSVLDHGLNVRVVMAGTDHEAGIHTS